MNTATYDEIRDVDLTEFKEVFAFVNSTSAKLSVALEPWACAVDIDRSERLSVYVPLTSSELIEFVEDERNERMIGVNAESMAVKIGGRIIALLPDRFPREKDEA